MSQIKRYCVRCQSRTWHDKYKSDSVIGNRQSTSTRVVAGILTSGLSEIISSTVVQCCDCGKKTEI